MKTNTKWHNIFAELCRLGLKENYSSNIIEAFFPSFSSMTYEERNEYLDEKFKEYFSQERRIK